MRAQPDSARAFLFACDQPQASPPLRFAKMAPSTIHEVTLPLRSNCAFAGRATAGERDNRSARTRRGNSLDSLISYENSGYRHNRRRQFGVRFTVACIESQFTINQSVTYRFSQPFSTRPFAKEPNRITPSTQTDNVQVLSRKQPSASINACASRTPAAYATFSWKVGRA
jgi:hypothetical protein